MKKALIVYFSDNSANVVICDSISDIPVMIGESKCLDIVKIDCVPFEVLM